MNNSENNERMGTSEVSAKDILNTHDSGEPSADNVNISPDDWKNADRDTNPENSSENNERMGTSEISAKDVLNTHDSGEPDADNVNVSAKDM